MNPSANHTATPAGIIGMPGWFASEQAAGFDRNRWLVSSEYAACPIAHEVFAGGTGDRLEVRILAQGRRTDRLTLGRIGGFPRTSGRLRSGCHNGACACDANSLNRLRLH